MNLRTLDIILLNVRFIEKISTVKYEIMKERRSFTQNLKAQESGRSGNRRISGRPGREEIVAIGAGSERPGGREAGSSSHQCTEKPGCDRRRSVSSEFAKFSLPIDSASWTPDIP
jgi:hypothetical protein